MKKSLLIAVIMSFGAQCVLADGVVEDKELTLQWANPWTEEFGTLEMKDGVALAHCISTSWKGGSVGFEATQLDGYNQIVVEYSATATFQAWAQGGAGEAFDNLTNPAQLPFWKTSQAFDITGVGPLKQICIQDIGASFDATISKVYLRNYAPEYADAEDITATVNGENFSLSEFAATLGDEDVVELSGTCATNAGWGVGAIEAGENKYLNINSSDGTTFSVKVTGGDLKQLQTYVQTLSKDNYIYLAKWNEAVITSAKLSKVKTSEAPTIPTPVNSVNGNAEVVKSVYFTITGAQVEEPQKGINIVKQTLSDGSTRIVKVLVK